MKFYIKSAGRKDTQDYVWVCLSGEETPSDLALISKAERSVSNQGIVYALSPSENGQIALFLGNVRSNRTDFYGTPIYNRISIVCSENDNEQQNLIRTLISEWMSESSELISLLHDGIVKSDNLIGFEFTQDFMPKLKAIMGKTGDNNVPRKIMAHDSDNTSLQTAKKENSKMRIAINTVPSGNDDYDWYFGECPSYARDIWNICEKVKASIASKCFFASLHKQPKCWCLFLQDIIGNDKSSRRAARGTISIEIPDDTPFAEEKARKLLISWLTPNSPLLEIFKNNVDVSSEKVVVKNDDLYSSIENLTRGERLSNEPLSSERLLYRISKDLSNVSELRLQAIKFVRSHQFNESLGVHFLFTHCPYSTATNNIDKLPDMPAKFIVLGWRDDEARDYIPSQQNRTPNDDSGTSGTITQSGHPVIYDASHKRGKEKILLIVGAVAVVLLIVYFAFFSGHKGVIKQDSQIDKMQKEAQTSNHNDIKIQEQIQDNKDSKPQVSTDAKDPEKTPDSSSSKD